MAKARTKKSALKEVTNSSKKITFKTLKKVAFKKTPSEKTKVKEKSSRVVSYFMKLNFVL